MTQRHTDREFERDQILAAYEIVFTEQEKSFDDLVHLVAATMDVPVAFFALMTSSIHWIKAGYGIGQITTPRRDTMCNTSVEGGDPLIVPDASRDPRFASHPVVEGKAHLRGYLSYPILGYGGIVVGTLCVYDTRPRQWTDSQVDLMRRFASQFELHLENRRKFKTLRRTPSDTRNRAVIASVTSEQCVINRRIIHDVRNYIATVSANASVLEHNLNPMERREIVSDVLQACEKVMEVVGDLEEFAVTNRGLAEQLEQDTEVEFTSRQGESRTPADSGCCVG